MSPESTDPNADLADIRQHWLRFCSHDTGLPYPCICPTEDHRPVIAALVGEVETLRARLAEVVKKSQAKLTAGEHDEPCPHDRPVGGWQSAKCVKPRGHETHWNGSGDVWRVDVKGMAAEVETLRAEVARLEGERDAESKLRQQADAEARQAIKDREASDRLVSEGLVLVNEGRDLVAEGQRIIAALATERDDAIRVAAARVLEARQALTERDEAQQTLMEANATIVRAMEALGVDHPVWLILDDYDGSMDNVTALVTERDEAQALLRLAPHHQQQVETLEYELVQAGAEVNRLTAQRDDARADAERMRVVLALHGSGIDPNGYYEGTPGSRLRELLAAERELVQARAELRQLKGERLLSVVFGHHKGAPRPFALYRRDGYAPRDHNRVALGAEFDDGAVALRLVDNGGWKTVSTGGAESLAANDCLVIWLSDELEPLAAMETERDEARAEVLRLTAQRDEALTAACRAGATLISAVDQMAPSTPPSTPESDGQGEVAVTDAVEAPGGAEGERCPSCEHSIADFHDGGCWFTVVIGTLDQDTVCRCTWERLDA